MEEADLLASLRGVDWGRGFLSGRRVGKGGGEIRRIRKENLFRRIPPTCPKVLLPRALEALTPKLR